MSGSHRPLLHHKLDFIGHPSRFATFHARDVADHMSGPHLQRSWPRRSRVSWLTVRIERGKKKNSISPDAQFSRRRGCKCSRLESWNAVALELLRQAVSTAYNGTSKFARLCESTGSDPVRQWDGVNQRILSPRARVKRPFKASNSLTWVGMSLLSTTGSWGGCSLQDGDILESKQGLD